MNKYSYRTLFVENDAGVLRVVMNKPKGNPIDDDFISELGHCFKLVREDSDVRCCLLSSMQKHFCVGLDLKAMATGDMFKSSSDASRTAFRFINSIRKWQTAFSAISECGKP